MGTFVRPRITRKGIQPLEPSVHVYVPPIAQRYQLPTVKAGFPCVIQQYIHRDVQIPSACITTKASYKLPPFTPHFFRVIFKSEDWYVLVESKTFVFVKNVSAGFFSKTFYAKFNTDLLGELSSYKKAVDSSCPSVSTTLHNTITRAGGILEFDIDRNIMTLRSKTSYSISDFHSEPAVFPVDSSPAPASLPIIPPMSVPVPVSVPTSVPGPITTPSSSLPHLPVISPMAVSIPVSVQASIPIPASSPSTTLPSLASPMRSRQLVPFPLHGTYQERCTAAAKRANSNVQEKDSRVQMEISDYGTCPSLKPPPHMSSFEQRDDPRTDALDSDDTVESPLSLPPLSSVRSSTSSITSSTSSITSSSSSVTSRYKAPRVTRTAERSPEEQRQMSKKVRPGPNLFDETESVDAVISIKKDVNGRFINLNIDL